MIAFRYQPTSPRCHGFTILEVVMAISIISLGMIGILSLVIQSNKVNTHNDSLIVAFMLAQEGVELVRNERDSAQKVGSTIMNFSGQRTYRIDKDGVFTTTNPTTPLLINGNGEYQYGNGATTKFSRELVLTATDIGGSSSASDQLYVVARVSWVDAAGSSFTFLIDTYLYDWR